MAFVLARFCRGGGGGVFEHHVTVTRGRGGWREGVRVRRDTVPTAGPDQCPPRWGGQTGESGRGRGQVRTHRALACALVAGARPVPHGYWSVTAQGKKGMRRCSLASHSALPQLQLNADSIINSRNATPGLNGDQLGMEWGRLLLIQAAH